jgi:hypothetical protein
MTYPASLPQQFVETGLGPSELGRRTDEQIAKDCEKNLSILAQYRLLWEPMIDNLILYINHGRRSVQDKDLWPGQPTGMFVYDDTAMLARNMATDGMVGYLCSRNQPWFAAALPGKFNFPRASGMRAWSGKRMDEYPLIRKWLQDCETVLYSALTRSNFYDIIPEFISDGMTVGTAYMIIEEDITAGRIIFLVPHFREMYIAENQYGKVDTTYRVYKMTLRQLADKFGFDVMKSVDESFENKYTSNMHQEMQILHAVYPRKDYFPPGSQRWEYDWAYAKEYYQNQSRVDGKGKKWESVWVYHKDGKLISPLADRGRAGNNVKLLSESGYDSLPNITWRWRKNNDEILGRGPGHDAWVAIATCNQMGKDNLNTGHRASQPPLVAYSDLRGLIQKDPDAVTYIERNRGDIRTAMPQPLYSGTQSLPFNIEFQDKYRQIINSFFHTDVFMMMSQLAKSGDTSRMVIEQVQELQGEKAAILGTRVGNLQSEAFDPLIFRVFDIEARAGRIPDPPDILLNTVHGPVEIQYLGMLAQAQTRLSKVRSIQAGIMLTKQVAEINPIAMDVVDYDQAEKEILDATNFPATCIRSDDDVNQIRQIRNKMAEQERQVEAAPKLAKAAAAMGRATEENSPLRTLMGGGSEEAGA